MGKSILALVAATIFAVPPLEAATRIYTLDIPSGRTAHYELELDVEHPGTVRVHADWSGPTTLAFRIDPPEEGPSIRRSGPSPQLLRARVSETGIGTWTLSIHALPTRKTGSGRVTVEIPDGRPATPAAKPRLDEPPPPAEPLEAWMLPRRAPRTGSPDQTRVVETTERFRALVVDREDEATDACRWQTDLLRFLAVQRDRLLETGELPSVETRKLLTRTVSALQQVEEFRTSSDPVVAGPRPADPALREAWERLRRSRMQPLEEQLDELLDAVRRQHAPDLSEQHWPVRLVSCLTACQRHFEERTRLGEKRAANRELALAQWDRLLAATEALDALARVKPDPIRIGSKTP